MRPDPQLLVADAARALAGARKWTPTERVCAQCGAPFAGKGRGRFCSNRCREKHGRLARQAKRPT